MNIELQLPVKDVQLTQDFALNYLDFYKDMGLDGHPGIDLRAKNGCNLHCAIDGYVHWQGKGADGGICIMIYSEDETHGILYYHNQKNFVKKNDKVKRGDLIALADNTGKYTTGNHLHFELYLLENKQIINRDNGFNGRIDPGPYFKYTYNGIEIKNKDKYKSNAYHRYGRKKSYMAEFWYRFTPLGVTNKWTLDGRWVQKQLRKRNLPLLTTEQVNAILYGGWDFEAVINTAMREHWGWLKKSEFEDGMISFYSLK